MGTNVSTLQHSKVPASQHFSVPVFRYHNSQNLPLFYGRQPVRPNSRTSKASTAQQLQCTRLYGSISHTATWLGRRCPQFSSMVTQTFTTRASSVQLSSAFTSTSKILQLALGTINLVVYHGLITHDSYNILSSQNEPITQEQLNCYLLHVGHYHL